MIPLRDSLPSRSTPYVTMGIIAANCDLRAQATSGNRDKSQAKK